MKVITTPRELFEKDVWDRACELLGISVWCVNEGQMLSDEEIPLTKEQAIELGLLTEDRSNTR